MIRYIEKGDIFRSDGAVSYTHLDVYKRQALDVESLDIRPLGGVVHRFRPLVISLFGHGGFEDCPAVSSPHLDVYKIQS